ncbi:hypothetical protein R1flu_013034 [Riccia fluitans]|uniref:Uncharacterized protein n=1 Tax=Riccia fluitans TaxID=41844 RepID=A0ABD1ZCC4_9MARC
MAESVISIDEHDELEIESEEPLLESQPSNVFPNSQQNVQERCKITKKRDLEKGKKRQMVDQLIWQCWLLHITSILYAYYSKTRKKASKQTIPNNVWKLVFINYKKVHTGSKFSEDTLEELQTGTSNEGAGAPATLQSDEFLVRIRETNGHHSQNFLNKRSEIISPALA